MTNDLVAQTRQGLGRAGALLPNNFGEAVPAMAAQREAVQRLEAAGIGTAWATDGVGAKDGLVQLALLLAATERMTFGTAVLSVWSRPPETAHGAAAMLADAFPGRFVLGLGVGYAMQADVVGGRFEKPLSIMRNYFERMTTAPPMMPIPVRNYARLLAANNPRMITLAGEIADGALPTMVPPKHTYATRGVLGPDKLLVVGLTSAFDHDRSRAKETARQFMRNVARPGHWSAAALGRLGYELGEHEADLDRAVDDVLAYGDDDAIVAKAREHLDAGADHVRISVIAPDYATGVDQLERLGPAVAGLSAAR